MGHRITTQSRGKGRPTYRLLHYRGQASQLKHIGDDTQKITGSVIDIEHYLHVTHQSRLLNLKTGRKSTC